MEKKNSLLIVDDDASNLMELASILKSDYKIYAVKDGAPALEKANEAMPDLILLDVVMPDMNGFEVLNELRKSERTKDIPVIFITGVNDSESEREGLAGGAVDYIRKPFNAMVVKHRVRLQIQIINLQRELESAANIAEAANQSKSSFLANMSHEIRTPMNAIMGITDILRQSDDVSPDEIFEGLEKIYNSSEMLLDLINDILDFSKIEAGKLDILPTRYRIANLINDTIHLNMMRIEEKPIKFELLIEEDIPAKLVGDELRIKQILNNLLSNAFKYTSQGKVTLSVSYEADTSSENIILILSVRDTGSGMTPEQLEMLFEEYSRFNEVMNRSIEGTGLGLSIMQRLLDLMNGSVNVESEPGVGTNITIKLPQGTVDANVLGKRAADDLRQFKLNINKHRENIKFAREPMPYGSVLIVDDTETNLFVAVRFMKPYKLKIDTANDGLEAINKVESGNNYDVIFMDHMMPEMDGIEATKRLREKGYTMPIVALTANAMTGQAEMFLQNGFDEFISKPIDMRQLDSVLLKLIRDKQHQDVIDAANEQDRSGFEVSEAELEADPLLLESFINDGKKAMSVLNEVCNESGWINNEDALHKFVIAVHGMKSVLEFIGEKQLSDLAKVLETNGREKNTEYIESEAPGFIEKLSALLSVNEKKLNKIIANKCSDQNKDPENLHAALTGIIKMCSDFNRKGILDAIAAIENYSVATHTVFEKIKENILHSDFEEAESTAAEYAASLSAMKLSDKTINGLDLKAGLKRYEGNEKVFLKTLRSFTAGTTTMLDSIREFNENDISGYKIIVHGIKGSGYDIKANEIGKLAEELENAANNNDIDFIKNTHPIFMAKSTALIEEINNLISEHNAANPKPSKDKPDTDLLTRLMTACEDYSMDDVDAVMAEIEVYTYEADDGLTETLRKCVDLVKFNQITEILKSII